MDTYKDDISKTFYVATWDETEWPDVLASVPDDYLIEFNYGVLILDPAALGTSRELHYDERTYYETEHIGNTTIVRPYTAYILQLLPVPPSDTSAT
ncbi:hypothetical protein BcepSauron_277 [Burkholderia phage BcepSauron]|uniref:Uncharacterized protein n=2 Tax=Sarumanvirus TaxID=2843450 RepID=A0A482MKV1_9CAUD|nr:hypothetical protein H1O16_gp276 [Burkholderia phage BcepSaruman]YP_009904655.1 hypothetical protein H1O17_gp277 [Burkholderia phage BcepSauron]QBQ74657.1 hypothetical protein BcepSauron_277 [Burkholderia phage BcepSauron]QBX06689.1 hypothetical protein BcepSaruman_276 [Burkholderia phage BcepSaruman]